MKEHTTPGSVAGRRAQALALLLGAVAMSLSGCQHVYENMYVDDQAGRGLVETASSARVKAMTGQSSQRAREHAAITAPSAPTTVVHGPLYFEDPFETKGSEDGRFAWTLEDYFALAYCDGRWLVNTIGLPVSLVVYPICCPAVTDGATLASPVLRSCCPMCSGGCAAVPGAPAEESPQRPADAPAPAESR